MATTRTEFNETWLAEMPQRLNSNDMYSTMRYNIVEYINNGITPIYLGNNLYKIELSELVYYWYQDNDTIVLAAELAKKPQGLVMQGVGKNKDYENKPPSAPTLYTAILNDTNRSIRFLSDTLMTDQGLGIWKRLFRAGHKISVYDNQNPGQSFKTFNSETEFDQYFGDKDKTRYQFILSEQKQYVDCLSYFLTRRMRELCGMGLID